MSLINLINQSIYHQFQHLGHTERFNDEYVEQMENLEKESDILFLNLDEEKPLVIEMKSIDDVVNTSVNKTASETSNIDKVSRTEEINEETVTTSETVSSETVSSDSVTSKSIDNKESGSQNLIFGIPAAFCLLFIVLLIIIIVGVVIYLLTK